MVFIGLFCCLFDGNAHAVGGELSYEDYKDNALYTQYQGYNVLIPDNEGNFLYQTNDVIKSSNTYYREEALDFSRIKSGVNPLLEPYGSDNSSLSWKDPHVYQADTSGYYTKKNQQREHFIVERNRLDWFSYPKNPKPGTMSVVTYVIPADRIWEALKVYPDWYTETQIALQNNQTIYFGIDGVIRMFYDDAPSGYIRNGKYYGSIYDWSNWEKLKSIGWSSSDTPNYSIPTHFNKYFAFADLKTPPPDEPEDNEPTPPSTDVQTETCLLVKNEYKSDGNVSKEQSGDSYAAPVMHTYNKSDTFNLGEAIPTTESYTNGIKLDSWYGSVKIAKKEYSHAKSIPFDVSYRTKTEVQSSGYDFTSSPKAAGETNGVKNYTGQNIKVSGGYQCKFLTTSYYERKYRYYGTKNIKMQGSYYTINDINLYQNNTSSVTTDYSTTSYADRMIVPYKATINGRTVSSSDNTKFYDTFFRSSNTVENDNHIDLDEFNQSLAGKVISGENIPGIDSKEKIKAYVENQILELQKSVSLKAKNDTLMINGINYLDENNVNFAFQKNTIVAAQPQENDTIAAEQSVTIPMETKNGKYYNQLQAKYEHFLAGNGVRTISLDDRIKKSKEAILPEYLMNEPISVFTPVISPISIVGEEKTQSVNPALTTQLLLDKTYTLKFDWNQYFHYKGYTNPAGWLNYVKDKQVRFPFTVLVNGTYYERKSTGYTDWISVGAIAEFNFYIPSWSQEGSYGVENDHGYGAINKSIEAKVFANNYGENAIMEEYEFNHDANNYVATYPYAAQVSGIMYDFQVNAINDELVFGKQLKRKIGAYDFADNKEEKKVGQYNRVGEKNLRYTKDGSLNTNWSPQNILPFTTGSSKYFSDMGYMIAGNWFTYSLKTISNLNSKKDSIQIKPNYRYIGLDGSQKDIDVYYSYQNEWFIKKDSKRDKPSNFQGFMLGDVFMQSNYYNYGAADPITQTAKTFDKTNNSVLYHKIKDTYRLGEINLDQQHELLTGNEEELVLNQNKGVNEALRYGEGLPLGKLTKEQDNAFKNSMQTWYGKYKIPEKLFICEKGAMKEFLKTHDSVSETSELWLKKGFLVLNFDITSSEKEAKNKHLSYYKGNNGNGLSMWTREAGSPVRYVRVKDIYEVKNIPIYDGDVAIISLQSKLADRYTEGILYIN